MTQETPKKKRSWMRGLGCLGCLGVLVVGMLLLFVLVIAGAGFFIHQSIQQSQLGSLFRVDKALTNAPKLATDSVTNLDALALDAAGCRWAVTVQSKQAQTLFAQFGVQTKPLGPKDPKVLMLCPSTTMTCEDVAAAWYRVHPFSQNTRLWILVANRETMSVTCHQIRNPSGTHVQDIDTLPDATTPTKTPTNAPAE